MKELKERDHHRDNAVNWAFDLSMLGCIVFGSPLFAAFAMWAYGFNIVAGALTLIMFIVLGQIPDEVFANSEPDARLNATVNRLFKDRPEWYKQSAMLRCSMCLTAWLVLGWWGFAVMECIAIVLVGVLYWRR